MADPTEVIRRMLARVSRRWPIPGERLVIGALLVAVVALLILLVPTVVAIVEPSTSASVKSSAVSAVSVLVCTVVALLAVGFILARLTLPRHFDSARDRLIGRAVAKERQRFARDLHDLLGHRLSAIAIKSELARRHLPDRPERAHSELEDVVAIARQAQSDVRAVAHSYPTSTLQDELASAYAVLESAGFHCRVDVACGDLPPRISEALAHVVREAVTNVVRHGSSGGCEVQLVERDGRVALTISNDRPEGFDDPGNPRSPGAEVAAADPLNALHGRGVANIRERVAAIGGTVTAGPSPAGQYRLRVTVPLAR